jgi:hypothetical protein
LVSDRDQFLAAVATLSYSYHHPFRGMEALLPALLRSPSSWLDRSGKALDSFVTITQDA